MNTSNKSRHHDCFQLEWRAGSKMQVINLSKQQVRDYLLNDVTIRHFISDFIEKGMDVYELLQEKSQPQTEEGEGQL